MAYVPTEAGARKALPIVRGVLDYFPDALLAIAEVSRVGNEQHNPGEPMHWAKEKSTDEADALVRHLLERGTLDPTDGLRHSAKAAWRALALLQREIEAERAHDEELRQIPHDECPLCVVEEGLINKNREALDAEAARIMEAAHQIGIPGVYIG